jgi:hypothetical protein
LAIRSAITAYWRVPRGKSAIASFQEARAELLECVEHVGNVHAGNGRIGQEYGEELIEQTPAVPRCGLDGASDHQPHDDRDKADVQTGDSHDRIVEDRSEGGGDRAEDNGLDSAAQP